MNALKLLAPALLLVALSGCATYPISKNLRQRAQIITISQAKADPESTRGAVVIWGGRIVSVVNDTNGGEIYVVCLPIRSNEKPLPYGPSPGRFIAKSTGFLDPEMFPLHSPITVAGRLDGVRTEQLGTIQYAYPVLDIEETHVWPMVSGEYPPYPYSGYYGPDWGWDWGWDWGPDWWWGGVYYPYYYGGYYGGYHGYHGYNGGFHGGVHGGFQGGLHGGFNGGSREGGGFGGGAGGGGHGR